MAMKRKCDFESDESSAPYAKQLKCIPFPHYEPDNDVAMSDASSDSDGLLSAGSELYHTRLPSNASSVSSADSFAVNYPTFDLYPISAFDTPDVNESIKNVGLMQPSGSFAHHGTSCSQIPKLRMACAAGPDGRRTMWSSCEDCGAISMVDSD